MSSSKTIASTRKKSVKTKEKFSLVPAEAQRRIYELALRSILVREILGIAAEAHSDFAEIGAFAALKSTSGIFPHVHSVGLPVAQGAGLGAIAAEIAHQRESGSLHAASADGLSANEALLHNAIAGIIHRPNDLTIVSVGELTDRVQWDSVLRFAGRHRLPILFIVGGYYHSRRESSPDLRTLFAEYGLPVITVDGLDSIAAYRAATEAGYNARAGRGATILEASVILTANNHLNSHAPLDHLEQYMLRHGSWDDSWRLEVENRARQELQSLEEIIA